MWDDESYLRKKMIFYGILLALLSTVLGQFLRIEIGSGGILFSDVFLPLLIIVWAYKQVYTGGFSFLWKKLQTFPLFWESFALISIFSISLCIAGSELSAREFLESGFYLFRYGSLLVFAHIVYDELSGNPKKQNIFLSLLFFSGIALAILGFLQLHFYPDFKEMAKVGWDPHIGRLLSTWFDPNYLGGLFSFLLVLLAGIFSVYISSFLPLRKGISLPENFKTWYIILFFSITGILLLALLFTFSRSALLTFIIPVFLLGMIYFRAVFLIASLGILFVLPFSDRAMQRIGDGIASAVSVSQEAPLFLPDPTARLRVDNFAEGIGLISQDQTRFWTGIGFNTIRFYRTENINSSGGFDASLLNILVTSGIFGLVLFLWFHFALIQKILRHMQHSSPNNPLKKGIQRGLIFSLPGIFAQSFFINFLFFPLFLLYFFGILGYALSSDNK